MLISQSPPADRSETLRAHTAPSVPPASPIDQGWVDWGVAIGVCLWVGNKLLGLFNQQQSADSKAQELLLNALLEQNKMLITTLTQVLSHRQP